MTLVILKVSCDNFYMFKDFELDFTYDRKISHRLAANDELFEGSRIKVRKNIILMGANASGKTTFGKLMCLILNFILGRPLDDKYFNLAKIQYDKTRDAFFEIEFAVKNTNTKSGDSYVRAYSGRAGGVRSKNRDETEQYPEVPGLCGAG